jgi:hypothetical protein
VADKVDFKKELSGYKARKGVFSIVEIPPLQYVMIDGFGDPNGSAEFAGAMETLYPISYTLKFFSKKSLGRDYVVGPPEGLWWADDMSSFTVAEDKSQWHWTLMILVPDWLGAEEFENAKQQVAAKGDPPPYLDAARLESLEEGRCVQTLHVGPFDAEGPVIAELHERFLPDNGLRPRGKHHEIYLSDFRRVEPEKLRTILRQPVEPA